MDNNLDVENFTRLRDETRHRITGTKPLPEQMKIFNEHINKFEKSISTQEEDLAQIQCDHVKTLREKQERLASFRDLLATAEFQSKQLEKPPTQADVLLELVRVQKLLARVSLLDNQFGIDDMHLTFTIQVIEQKLAAMKEQNGAVDTKEVDATQKMEVAHELLLAATSPEFIFRTQQAEAIITGKDAEIASIKTVYGSQTKALIADMKIKADKEQLA